MERDPLWVRQASGTHWLMRERSFREALGWVVVVLAPVAGIFCGIGALMLGGGDVLVGSPAWLAIPFAIPVAVSIAARRSVALGVLGGILSSVLAFLTVGAYAIAQIACFVITFMGEC